VTNDRVLGKSEKPDLKVRLCVQKLWGGPRAENPNFDPARPAISDVGAQATHKATRAQEGAPVAPPAAMAQTQAAQPRMQHRPCRCASPRGFELGLACPQMTAPAGANKFGAATKTAGCNTNAKNAMMLIATRFAAESR
jgi:hypothetical protein